MVSTLEFEEPSTKDAVAALTALDLTGRTLVVLHEPERITELSFRNLPHVKVTFTRSLSVYDLVAADHVLFTEAALDVLEGKEPGPRPASSARSEAEAEKEAADSRGEPAESTEQDQKSGEDES